MSDEIRLSTGTTIDANRGIVGIDASLDVFGGYDESIDVYEFDNYGAKLTNKERVELANLMIARWQEYRTCAGEPNEDTPRPTVALGVFAWQ